MNTALLDRATFYKIYNRLAPLAYGIACRIAHGEHMAQDIVTHSFETLHRHGNLNQAGIKDIITYTFNSARVILSGLLTMEEIHLRIEREQNSLLQGCRSRGKVDVLL